MSKILVVEDDPSLLKTVKEWLEFEHNFVESTSDGGEALELLAAYKYDLIILDWELPTKTGIEICQTFRSRGGQTPILFLTGKQAIPDKETGFSSGADDYLTKPFHLKELSMRLKALLRRAPTVSEDVLKMGSLQLNPETHQLLKNGKEVKLSPIEFALMEFFMRNPKTVFSTEAILERVWTAASERSPETLRTCFKRLRDKIDDKGKPSVIQNVHGVGYKFEPGD